MIGAGLKKPAEDVSGKITRTLLNKIKKLGIWNNSAMRIA